MPTARELLEQADALMRRNRANTLDDIPVLMDVVPAAVVAPGLGTDVPLADRGPPSVPLLTENIDVVDEDATLGAETIEGEPSAWLEFEDANPSVIGDAPDSIAIVPPVELRATPPDEALLASAEHEEIEFTLPVEESAAAEAPAEVTAAVAEENLADELAEVLPEVAMVTTPAVAGPVLATPSSPPPADTGAFPDVAAGLAALAASAPATAAAAAPAPTPVPAPAVLAMADDDERWVAAAEEIRMQVLQRIDLFTDTGLRDQLAQRLQPIADRASADLVKAINVHVGDLLRTYVAEAIEREIERWRRDH